MNDPVRISCFRPSRYVWLAAFVWLLACQPAPGGGGRDDYSIGFNNATKEEFQDVRAVWKWHGHDHTASAGVLPASNGRSAQGAEDGDQPRPIPKKVTVFWKTPDGKEHRKVVEVAKLIKEPDSFSGTVWLKFTEGGGIDVVPLTYEERHRKAVAGEPYP